MATPFAHPVISEDEESNVESVGADSHIPGRDCHRKSPSARMGPTTLKFESDGQGPEQGDWRWAFQLGVVLPEPGVRAGQNTYGLGLRRRKNESPAVAAILTPPRRAAMFPRYCHHCHLSLHLKCALRRGISLAAQYHPLRHPTLLPQLTPRVSPRVWPPPVG